MDWIRNTASSDDACGGSASTNVSVGANLTLSPKFLDPRSEVIATYALCGFANPGSIGVQLATLSSMAPGRKSDFADVAFRAFVSGSMACFLTACIAGALYDEKGFIRL